MITLATGRNPSSAILFDWGETLICIPGMVHSAEHHLACVERMYCEAGDEDSSPPALRYGIHWPEFRAAYRAAAIRQMAWSAKTGREHSFEGRFADAFSSLGVSKPFASELSALVNRLGDYIVDEAVAVDGAQEVLPVLAEHYRLGLVSNYPSAPLVARTLERFGLLRFFSGIVVSGEFGWLKPHPDVYREALRRVDTRPGRALFVGDDLRNDVKGPKALGMQTAWFAPGEANSADPDVDAHIRDLRELPAWCRGHLEPSDIRDA
jgi:HAD superfamily hydrolase (TIGR01549 family)